MASPLFIHVQSNGDIWASSDQDFTPSGTNLAIYRVNSLTAPIKIGTVSGNSGSYASSSSTGKYGKEVTGR